jgi:RNA polymerase sigma-70 factor (ECF subfamily)
VKAQVVWKLTDESLLAGLGSSDPDSAVAFVRRFQARVFGLTFSILRDRGAAEEAAQEAFVRAWRHAGNFDPRRGRAATWLLTIVRNLAIDALRMRRDLPVEPSAMADLFLADHDSGDRVADAEHISAALRSLPREQAVAVVLSVHFGLTAREISARQHIPLGTAKTRIRTGLTRLRTMLEVGEVGRG